MDEVHPNYEIHCQLQYTLDKETPKVAYSADSPLTLAGEIRSDLYRCCELTRTLFRRDLKDSIEFWGIRHDVPKILRTTDAFARTSVSDAASLTPLEAMASGCPAVLTDVGGNAKHATHGLEGLLAPRSDSQTIREQLLEILSSRDQCEAMGAAARKRVERNFQLTGVIEQYAAHFKKLAEC